MKTVVSNPYSPPLAALAGLACLASVASSQTITVTTSRDVVDVPTTATIADLPGPDGKVSFREALRASDNTAGRQTIGFAIPELDWYLPNIYPGRVLLQGNFAWSASQPVTIDGTTQTAFTGDTFAGGNEMVLYGLMLGLAGDGSELLGFHDSRIIASGSSCDIHDNTGGMYITLSSGSGSVVHDNEAWTITIQYSSDNVIVRNVTERVRISGQGTLGPPASGNRIGGPDPADRNFITGFGNYGEHGVPAGDCIELYYTNDTLIQNNYLGTTPDGMAISNRACTTGIAIQDSNDNVHVRDNLIAVQAVGVYPATGVPFGQALLIGLYLGGTGIEITGNTLGLNALGEPVLGTVNGVVVSRYASEFATGIRLGGPNPGEGNVIAGHLEAGVLVPNGPGIPSSGNIRLSGNSIHHNGVIGIDLMPNTWDFGPTPNDLLDADDGANGLQNHPELAGAARLAAAIRVTGQLHSTPLEAYTLEFFASPVDAPAGTGTDQVFLGSTLVATDAAGNAPFLAVVAPLVPEGWYVAATATLEPGGRTSEFSGNVPIVAAGTGPKMRWIGSPSLTTVLR